MGNLEKIESLSTFKKVLKSQCFYSDNYDFSNSTLYFGTGLASVNNPSSGFGVEILMTILTALWLKKNLGFDKVIHEISTVGYNINSSEREALILEEGEFINKLIKALHLEDSYVLNFSHDYHNSEIFKKIQGEVEDKMKQFKSLDNFGEIGLYTVLQVTGMKYLYDNYKTRIKLGWITDKRPPLENVSSAVVADLINVGHLNEYYFDNIYKFVFPNDEYTFLYTPCAIDFINGNRTVPYTVVSSQNRPVLNKDDLMKFYNTIPETKLKKKILKAWKEEITDVFEELFYDLQVQEEDEDKKVMQKIIKVQEKILTTNIEKSKIA